MNYIRNNIWKLYAIRFFHNLIHAYVIERLFWEQRGKLSGMRKFNCSYRIPVSMPVSSYLS